MKNICLFLTLSSFIISCSQVKEKAKDTINEGGEVVGKTATEFFEGVSEGVDQTLECKISLSESLKEMGLSYGKYSILRDSGNSKRNKLTLYLIFDKDFKHELVSKVFDKNGDEIGRTKLKVEGTAGDAGYFDLVYDPRTDIEAKSKISIE